MKHTLLLALICGILAALCTALYLNSLESAYRKGTQKTKVLIAKQYIDQGTVIDGTLLEERLVPKDYLQPRAMQEMKDLTNPEGKKMFMTIVPIEKGEQVVTTKLVMMGMDTGLSTLIPSDKRAVTLVLDRDKVAGLIKPGNRVDILGVFDYEDKERRTQEASATVLQNILVLAVGKSYLGTLNPLETRKGTEKETIPEQAEGRTPVSLALSPQEAELLVLSAEKGTIYFSLRPTGDDRIAAVPASRMQDIFKDVSTVITERGNEKTSTANSIREMQMKQREALDILKRYQKN